MSYETKDRSWLRATGSIGTASSERRPFYD
jgi:hypothetical protein